jgi:tetratricopeptide (TPR) repeat protein
MADAYAHLSRLSASLGRLARAEETALSAILILERSPGSKLAAALESLGAIYERADRRDDAAKLYERAKEVRKFARAASV